MSTSTPVLPLEVDTKEVTRKLALLIDADNVTPSSLIIKNILDKAACLGEITVKRIYGDFTSSQNAAWREIINRHVIKPMQQFAYTARKNVTDSAMIIDAMDLLYTKRFDGFCIVSSDSDFTGLAVRIREQGLKAYGFGAEKTPKSFKNACHDFFVVKTTLDIEMPLPVELNDNDDNHTELANLFINNNLPLVLLKEACELASDESGWTQLGGFGSCLVTLEPDFKYSKYGYERLTDLVCENTHFFEIKHEISSNLYLRIRPQILSKIK